MSSMNRDGFKPHPNDSIIVVMGPTGSGKTNFINSLTGNAEKPNAAGLKSATQGVTPYTLLNPCFRNSRLVLVDTPGFDDTCRSDFQILESIANWLTMQYPGGGTIMITGVIYLHRITDNRMSGSAHRNLQLFGRICGCMAMRRAYLVTTMWDIAMDSQTAERRERELIDDFWRPLIAEGATTAQFGNEPSSSRQIIESLITRCDQDKLRRRELEELLLQEEIVKQNKRVNETEAGKVLYSRLQKLLAGKEKMLKDLAEEPKLQNNPTLARGLEEERKKISTQLQKTFEETKTKKIPLVRRIYFWLFGRRSRNKALIIEDMR